LQKALAVEAEKGFTDLQGNQYRFSEFLCLSLGKTPNGLLPVERRKWQSIAAEFERYHHQTLEARQSLITDTQQFLNKLQQELQRREQETIHPPQTPTVKSPRTTPLVAETSKVKVNFTLDSPLSELPDIGYRRSGYLARLGLHTVRDILYYYPRDHIDYARQVNVQDLVAGETVTVVGKVKRCNCFSSPKNKKLSIFELIIKDSTGQLKLNRFFAGNRYSHRGWQEQQKRRYPPGAIVAASGLVKKNKYGITLDTPEIEVLDHLGGRIDSFKIGRVMPVYPLTEGVPADWVRQAVLAALPAVNQLKEPLPKGMRQQYDLMGVSDAIANLHFPTDTDTLSRARRRLVFDEFFYLQLGFLQRRKMQQQQQSSAVLAPTGGE